MLAGGAAGFATAMVRCLRLPARLMFVETLNEACEHVMLSYELGKHSSRICLFARLLTSLFLDYNKSCLSGLSVALRY